MDINSLINGGVVALVGIIAYILKMLYDKINSAVTEERVRALIEDKIVPILQQNNDLKADIGRLEGKIDYIMDRLIRQGDQVRQDNRDDDSRRT